MLLSFHSLFPIIMLGVPISDTFFAIVRRIRMKQKITAPDKSHLHHCLLRAGFSHRQTVLDDLRTCNPVRRCSYPVLTSDSMGSDSAHCRHADCD